MFIATHHQITDPEHFQQQLNRVVSRSPAGLQLHSTIEDKEQNLYQCMWEADSIDQMREYLEPVLGKVSVNTYFEVDPYGAIG